MKRQIVPKEDVRVLKTKQKQTCCPKGRTGEQHRKGGKTEKRGVGRG